MKQQTIRKFFINALTAAFFLCGFNISAQEQTFNFDNASGSLGEALKSVSAAPLLLPPAPSVRAVESIRELKIVTYNIRDLMQEPPQGFHWDPVFKRRLKQVWPEYEGKSPSQLMESARAILDIDPDIVVLQEVENIAVLGKLNSEYLNDEYLPFLIEGNDERGIDIGFLVKKDLPFNIEHRTHKTETWKDPLSHGMTKTLFSRDLPALIVRAEGREKPLFVLFGTHFKSKRTVSPKDPESHILRKAQVDRTAEIVKRYRQELGQNVPILLAGDFNGSLHSEDTFDSLWKTAGLADTFDLLSRPPPPLERVTHTFHALNGENVYDQIDAILVSAGLRASVKDARVYRYEDGQGTPKRLPESYQERETNPSDHYPVEVTLDFQSLLSLR